MRKFLYFRCNDLPIRFGETGCCIICHDNDDYEINFHMKDDLFEYTRDISIEGDTYSLVVIFCCKRLPPKVTEEWFDLYKTTRTNQLCLPPPQNVHVEDTQINL